MTNSLYSLVADCEAFARFRAMNDVDGNAWSLGKEHALKMHLTRELGIKRFTMIESLSCLGPLREDDVIAVICA